MRLAGLAATFLIGLAAPACAQTSAPLAPAAPPPGEFNPFIEPGFEDRRAPPPGSDIELGEKSRGIGGSTEFGFDELMTPGARGSKRSLRPRSRSPFDPLSEATE